ncbi:MAG: hypothetical protein M0R74_00060 [Dehalococcoidia bacterium]|nr:hypothetical protein [Dehalococcoidia bacterium]
MVQLTDQAALDNLLGMLRVAVSHLAAEPGTQLAYLEDLDTTECADELALEFDDAFSASHSLLESGKLSESAMVALRALDAKLGAMPPRDDLWTREALQNAPEWVEVRQTARHVLEQLTA